MLHNFYWPLGFSPLWTVCIYVSFFQLVIPFFSLICKSLSNSYSFLFLLWQLSAKKSPGLTELFITLLNHFLYSIELSVYQCWLVFQSHRISNMKVWHLPFQCGIYGICSILGLGVYGRTNKTEQISVLYLLCISMDIGHFHFHGHALQICS